MNFKILLLITFIPWIASAEVACLENTKSPFDDLMNVVAAVEEECPNARPLRGICNHVIDPEDHGGEQSHLKKLKAAACVMPGDSPEVEGQKIRAMWDKYEDKLVCDSIAFSVRGGNIIKATLHVLNNKFMETLMDWKVNLNRVDPADDRTVMDYIRDELNKNPPRVTKQFLEDYYRRLKLKGAKHKEEL